MPVPRRPSTRSWAPRASGSRTGRFCRQLAKLDGDEVRARAEYLKSTYLDQGVTFDIGGEERPFPLDIVPRVLLADEWAEVEAGVAQRVRALEAFLADVYGEGRVFRDGVIPRKVIVTSPHYHRVMAGVRPPNGVRCHVAGIDLVRDEVGRFRVLEDNVRVPSGVSYVMTNRRAMFSALPEVTSRHRIRPVEGYPLHLLAALRAAAPSGVSDPTVVVLTPGVYNSAYFEHALLARMMGVELVEGRDLLCHNGRVSIRTTQGLKPVHVIYRRVDDEFLDPAQFRSDSMLGCAGLITAARAGNVTLANAVGNGVADDKLVYTYIPDLIRYYLAEEPMLASVDTWRLEDAGAPRGGARPARRARAEAGGRLRRQGHRDRAAGRRQAAGRAARAHRQGPARLDRAAGGAAVHRPDDDRRQDGAPPRRPAAVRRELRRRGLRAARRPDPGGAAGGRTDRELQPGRRLQGHLGARPRRRPRRSVAGAVRREVVEGRAAGRARRGEGATAAGAATAAAQVGTGGAPC